MKYYHEVPADRYSAKVFKYKKMGLPTDHLFPVDMSGGYVPQNVDYSSKNSKKDMNIAAECINKRFGLGGEA